MKWHWYLFDIYFIYYIYLLVFILFIYIQDDIIGLELKVRELERWLSGNSTFYSNMKAWV